MSDFKKLFLLCGLASLVACSGESGESSDQKRVSPVPAEDVAEVARDDDARRLDGIRDQLPVAGEMLPYTESGDDLVRGYFAFPETMVEPLPAVIVIHEWWGLNDDIKAAAEKIAAQGFMTLAVDLYNGESTDSNIRAGKLSLELLDDMQGGDANIAAAITFLKEVAGAPRVATLGWSQGGQWSLRSAGKHPEALAAAVSFYGPPNTDRDVIDQIGVPVLAIFAGRDRTIDATDVEIFRAAAESLGKSVEVHMESDVAHGFANPSDARYREDAAERAFARSVRFLRDALYP